MASTTARSDDEDDILPSLVTLFEAPTDKICEFGDVTLSIHDDWGPTIHIRVSSCILATFSKVFKALLHGKFCEGRSEDVVLHEPPRPMLMMCTLLHLQPLKELPNSTEMMELAVLVDKYDCTEPLRYAITCLITSVAAISVEGEALGHLVTAAYVADQPEHFRKFTREMVLNSLVRPDQVDECCLERLPSELLASLLAQEAFARNELTLKVSTLMNNICTTGDGTDMIRMSMNVFRIHGAWPLDHRRSSIAKTLESLDRIDMGHMVHMYYEHRVRTTEARAAKEIENATHIRLGVTRRGSFDNGGGWSNPDPRPPPVFIPRPRPMTPTSVSRLPSRGDIERIVTEVKDLCVGSCLDCILGRSGKCRCVHPDPWRKWGVPCTCGSGNVWGQDHPCYCDLSPQKPDDWDTIW